MQQSRTLSRVKNPSSTSDVAVHGKQLHLEDIAIDYGQTRVVDGLSLNIEAGEFFTLLGPSGCGKTTTLRMVAGLIQPSEGTIRFDDRDVTRLPVHKRNISMVFQNYALMPHVTVVDNVAYGLKMRGIGKKERYRRAKEALEMVGLVGYEDRYITALSGGQQQRVGLARAVSVQSGLMLLDEPLSNLDTTLRQQMCVELRELQNILGVTILYVTHDRSEALSMSDRIGVMSEGSLLQVDAPEKLYRNPKHMLSARLLGDINVIEIRGDDSGYYRKDGVKLTVAAGTRQQVGPELLAGIRPESLNLLGEHQKSPQHVNTVEGTLVRHEYGGALHLLHVDIPVFETKMTVRIPDNERPTDGFPPEGATITIGWDPEDTTVFEDLG